MSRFDLTHVKFDASQLKHVVFDVSILKENFLWNYATTSRQARKRLEA